MRPRLRIRRAFEAVGYSDAAVQRGKDVWMRRLVIAGVIIVAAVAAFACDDDNNSDDDADATPRASATAGERTQPSGDGNGASREDVQRLIEKFVDSTFTGEYQALNEGGEDGLNDGTVTIYKKGTSSLRFDIRTQQDGEDVEVIFITAPDVSGFCMSGGAALGIPGGEGVCFDQDPTGGFALGDLSSELEALESQDFELLDSSSREIAGVGGTCFRTTDSEDGEESEVCLSEDGELLYVGGGSDGSEITATNVSGDVKDDAFTLPYEVQDFPTGE